MTKRESSESKNSLEQYLYGVKNSLTDKLKEIQDKIRIVNN